MSDRKIIKLSASNVQRIEAIEIEPSGAAVIIGGRNAQGKTSVLDAIEYALGGKSSFSEEPVRRGADTSTIVLNLGDLVVTRVITASGGGALKVTSAEGAMYSSPQAILDKMVGSLSLDPLEFMRQKPADQAKSLAKIVGINFDSFERKRKALYDDRTVLSRREKALNGTLSTMGPLPEQPSGTVDIKGIMDRLSEVNAAIGERDNARSVLVAANDSLTWAESKVDELIEQLEESRDRLAGHIIKRDRCKIELEAAESAVMALPNVDEIRLMAHEAQDRETQREKNASDAARHATITAELAGLKNEIEELSSSIKQVDDERDSAIESATFPVEGLGFCDSIVTYNGIPLSQASGAERLRVSMAIALSMNPGLRIALIRDGSLLDPEGLELVRDMAAKSGAQVWIERVGSGPECSVVIEDGKILGAADE